MLEWLKEHNIYFLHLNRRKLRSYLNPFQSVLLEILLNDYRIDFKKEGGIPLYKEGEFYLLNRKGPYYSDAILSKQGVKPELNLPKYPLFIIDLRYYNRHTEKEKRRIIKEILASLIEVRKYLWDRHLALVANRELFNFISHKLGNNKILRLDYPLNGIALDPNADEILTEKDIKENNIFLIGGIVDLGQNRPWTKELFKEFPRKRIEFYGKTKGVPDRFNRIISILLKVKFENKTIEEAIKENLTRKDILERLSIELPKRWVKLDNKFVLPKKEYEELNKMFGRDIKPYLKVFKVEVIEKQ